MSERKKKLNGCNCNVREVVSFCSFIQRNTRYFKRSTGKYYSKLISTIERPPESLIIATFILL